MTAERIVDILLEGDEAAEFFNQHLLDNPAFVFDGPGSWQPYQSELGDQETAQGENVYAPNDKDTYVAVTLWVHPTGMWYFRTEVKWKVAYMKTQWLEVGPHDIYAKTPEQKMQLLGAIQDFLPRVRALMAKITSTKIDGKRLRYLVKPMHYTAFGEMYSWSLGENRGFNADRLSSGQAIPNEVATVYRTPHQPWAMDVAQKMRDRYGINVWVDGTVTTGWRVLVHWSDAERASRMVKSV